MKTNQQIPFPKYLLEFSQVEKIDWQDEYEESFHTEYSFFV